MITQKELNHAVVKYEAELSQYYSNLFNNAINALDKVYGVSRETINAHAYNASQIYRKANPPPTFDITCLLT